MNGSNMSNSRTTLKNSFLNLIHSFRMSNYTKQELCTLIENKLGNIIKDKDQLKYILNHFIDSNYNSSENDKNAIREIIKLEKIFRKINTLDINNKLLDLILNSEKILI